MMCFPFKKRRAGKEESKVMARLLTLTPSSIELVPKQPQQPPTSPDADKLSYKPGDTLRMLREDFVIWWAAENMMTGERGLVPKDAMRLKFPFGEEQWFARLKNSFTAQDLLLSANFPSGAFIVTQLESEPSFSKYDLFVRVGHHEHIARVRRYSIEEREDRSFTLAIPGKDSRVFESMQQLVEECKRNEDSSPPILGVALTFPAAKIAPRSSDAREDYMETPASEFVIGKSIGKGSFGDARLAVWNKCFTVVIKQEMPGEVVLAREAKSMEKLTHPNLVRLLAKCTKQTPNFIVTDYFPLGSLENYVADCEKKGEIIPTLSFAGMASQIANGMRHLASLEPPILHRDLAARNVFVGDLKYDVPTVKVGDFGIARELDIEYKGTGVNNLTPFWRAPEVNRSGDFNTACDVWAFGVTLWEMFSYGKAPRFRENHQESVLTHGLDLYHGVRLPRPDECPIDVYNIMKLCWQKEQGDRPSFDVLFHFFDEYSEENGVPMRAEVAAEGEERNSSTSTEASGGAAEEA